MKAAKKLKKGHRITQSPFLSGDFKSLLSQEIF